MIGSRENQAMQETLNRVVRDMTFDMYGDRKVYKRPNLLGRLKLRSIAIWQRIQDAWLVLIGKADIYDGY